jgi:hypothetical protein
VDLRALVCGAASAGVTWACVLSACSQPSDAAAG